MGGVRLLALDGAKTIGGSKLLLNYDSTSVLLDFGTNFHNYGVYYEEFLTPRSVAGLLDFVVMDVLPDARNLYRKDLMHPGLKLKGPEIKGIDAVVISHAHADHFGDLGFLRLDVPAVASAMSAAVIKAVADSARADIGKDYISPTLRKPDNGSDQFVLASCTAKEMRECGVCGRDFAVTGDGAGKELYDFWAFSPRIATAKRPEMAKPHMPGELLRSLDSVKARAYPVDHSVKGACAWVFQTSQGNVIYTGDLRRHGIRGELTDDFVRAARSPRPHVLIIEGTRVGRTSGVAVSNEPTTEKDIVERACDLMAGMKGKFAIADFGPRNIERLETFLKAARECHRKMVVTAKDAYLLHAMHLVDKSVPVPGKDLLIYDCPTIDDESYAVYVKRHAYPRDTVRPSEVARSPGDFLMAFSFFDLKHLVDIRPSGGHYMYSACEAFSEEQEVDFVRMGAWLRRFGLEPHGIAYDGDGNPSFPKGPGSLHASGHASQSDIEWIVRSLDPEIVVPVHTEHPEWFAQTFGGRQKVIEPKKGEWIEFT
ncbi:MAG: MBL fold metallo-hydrolase [Thermoplasmata archaeon]